MAATGTPKKKLKPGEKFGLNRAIIIEAALKIVDKGDELSIANLAKTWKVSRGTIYGHFPSKLAEIQTEMARVALGGLGRPFAPNETWQDYLRALFRSARAAFKDRRNLAGLVATELSSDYYLNPGLVERILYALHVAGLSEEARAKALDLVMGMLIGFLAVDRPTVKSVSSPKWIEAQSKLIDALAENAFPETRGLKPQLIKQAASRSAQARGKQFSTERADRFSKALIAGLQSFK